MRRLDYQWKRQLKSEQVQASATKTVNSVLLQNILPLHVGMLTKLLQALVKVKQYTLQSNNAEALVLV